MKAEAARQSLLAARSSAEEPAQGEAQADPVEENRAQPSKPALRKGAPPGRWAARRPDPASGPRRPPRPQAPGPREARTNELAKRAQARRVAAGEQGTLAPPKIKTQRVEAPRA